MSSRDGKDLVRIHVVYFGVRAEGIYHPSSGLIDIISGPAHGGSWAQAQSRC